jgi:GNAT superfamily N-acetyltransferase
MPTVIAPFDFAAHLSDVYRISRDAWLADVPDIPFVSEVGYASSVQRPWPAHDNERYVALVDGVVAGLLRLSMPTRDNLENMELDLIVDVDRRRQGIGRALFDRAVWRANELGRKNLTSETIGGEPFAAAMGAKMVLAETRSRLDVPPADQERLDELLADAWRRAQGYRLVQWQGVPAEEFLADLAALDSRFYTDAPTGDLVVEAEKVDADRIRATEEHRAALGRTAFHSAVVHIASGRLVAWTLIGGDRELTTQSWQQLTIVDPAHRGHRLGMLIKLENLRFIRAGQPELTGIDTFNASANEHMLAINDTMGFRRVDQWEQWQLTL